LFRPDRYEHVPNQSSEMTADHSTNERFVYLPSRLCAFNISLV